MRTPAAGHSVPSSQSVKTDSPLPLKVDHGWQSVRGVRGWPRDGHVVRAQVGQGGLQGRHGQQDREQAQGPRCQKSGFVVQNWRHYLNGMKCHYLTYMHVLKPHSVGIYNILCKMFISTKLRIIIENFYSICYQCYVSLSEFSFLKHFPVRRRRD